MKLLIVCAAILMAFAILRPAQAHALGQPHQLAPAGVVGAASSSARQEFSLLAARIKDEESAPGFAS
jgi:hypothetical protein